MSLIKPLRVIAYKRIPVRLPFTSTAVVWLLLDRLPLPGWIHGVVWTFVVAYWILVLIGLWHQEQVDPLEPKP